MCAIIPEFYVSDIDQSVHFYTVVLGFVVLYERPEERFVYLEREGARLMLEQPTAPSRTWLTAPLTYPYGRGVNLQIEVANVNTLHDAVLDDSVAIRVPLEERWYRRNTELIGNRQFVIADPDGYLLRFFQDLGSVQE